jgi:toxin ParE1/3/4
MNPLRFAPEVHDELAEAADWYDSRRPGLGSELLDEIAAILPAVSERPRSFPRLLPFDDRLEIRRALLVRFPYAVVFLVRDHEIRVLAVAHVKRRPDYWINRTRE